MCGIAGKKLLAAKNVLDHTVHSSREDSQNRLWFWGLVFFNPLHTPTRVVCKQVSQLDCAGILLGSSGFRVGRRQPVGKNPLSLASHDSRSVLAVKGSLRRAKRAPLTAPGRSRGRNLYEGKGITGRYPRF